MIIAICDDVENDASHLYSLLNQYFENNNISDEIHIFSSGEDFLADTTHFYDIVFMDICMNGINGIEAAKRYFASDCRYVFTTTSLDFSLEAFSVNAAHYLIKPITYDMVSEAVERVFPKPKEDNIIYIKQKNITIPILQSKILYIEVMHNILNICTLDETIKTRMTLQEIFHTLNQNCFMRPQRSFIVNMNYIDMLSINSIVMKDNKEIRISRSQRIDIIKTYESFLFKKIREEGRT